MSILNYSTTISTGKTAGEIQLKLAKAKAQAVMCEFDDNGEVFALSFRIMTTRGVIAFRLPANIDGVYHAMCTDKKIPKSKKTKEQAARVAWRILKDWIEAQIAIVDAEMAEISEVFSPYAQGNNGQTLFQKIKENDYKMLTGGEQ